MTFLRNNEINATSDFLIRSGRGFFQFRAKNFFLLFFLLFLTGSWNIGHELDKQNFHIRGIQGIINTSVLVTFESS